MIHGKNILQLGNERKFVINTLQGTGRTEEIVRVQKGLRSMVSSLKKDTGWRLVRQNKRYIVNCPFISCTGHSARESYGTA